jgi:hypothetical protein
LKFTVFVTAQPGDVRHMTGAAQQTLHLLRPTLLLDVDQRLQFPQMVVERDLIISRALVALFADPFLAQELRFRGGTALNRAPNSRRAAGNRAG